MPPVREKKPGTSSPQEKREIVSSQDWSARRSYLLLALLTLACLLPFCTKAFHVDDTLFVRAAQNIQRHPTNPYGFELIWDTTQKSMSAITKNPPLACYYAALVGTIAGWSEAALHLGFLLPALVLVLATYRLASRFTRLPLIAACATLLAPGLLTSATSVMCDTMMLALWVVATLLWVEGLDENKRSYLLASGILIAACAVTKYFGVALIPLLLAYGGARKRRAGMWLLYLAVPLVLLVAYQFWTKALYGQGLLLNAAEFAPTQRASEQTSVLTKLVVGLSFIGGCMLPAVTFIPLVGKRKLMLGAVGAAILAAVALSLGWISLGATQQAVRLQHAIADRWPIMAVQLTMAIAGGIVILVLAAANWWQQRNAENLLLGLWIFGTFFFLAFLNWTINARSVLPLIPAAAIVISQQVELQRERLGQHLIKVAILALGISGLVAVWVASADATLANAGRSAAAILRENTRAESGNVWFQGHWGFQYYMEAAGARPLDIEHPQFRPGDTVIVPDNNIEIFPIPPNLVASTQLLEVPLNDHITTIQWELGAGFYSSVWGPLPFAAGEVPPERYFLLHMGAMAGTVAWP